MVLRTIVRDLLEEEGAFERVESHPEAEPSLGELCPAPFNPKLDGSDMPALLVAPPGEVRFRVLEEDGPVLLTGAVGVHFTAAQHLPEGVERAVVRFEVFVGEERRFEAAIPVQRLGPKRAKSEWRHLGAEGEAGLALEPGDEVRLRTRLDSPEGEAVASVEPMEVGFGKLRLERHETVMRGLASPERPNIVLILQDTQRKDRLSTYGYERETSPHLDALAERGLVYEEAYSTSSWTWPATASLFTGLLPHEHGVLDTSSCHLTTRLDTLPELLQRRGYTTAAFSGSGIIVPGKNFDQGFEHFAFERGRFRKTHEFLGEILEWVRANAHRRFFLYLHLVDPHGPHEAPDEALRRFAPQGPPEGWTHANFQDYTNRLKHGEGRDEAGELDPSRVVSAEERRWIDDVYDACTWTGDRYVGEVLALFDELGLSEKTVFAYTSDHGEELFDHGKLEHGHSLHRELVGVPLVLAGPGIPAGERATTPVSMRQLAPTLARLGDAYMEQVVDAQDLSRPGSLEARSIYFTTEHGFWDDRGRTTLHGVLDEGWLLHVAPRAPGRALYHLTEDPLAEADRSGPDAGRAAALEESVKQHFLELAQRRSGTAFAAGDATLEFLEGIGYIDGGEDE